MVTQDIPKAEWQSHFDKMSSQWRGHKVQIEIVDETLGDQIERGPIALDGVSYDHKDDSFYVMTPSLSHRIDHPQGIAVSDNAEAGNVTVAVRDENGRLHLITVS